MKQKKQLLILTTLTIVVMYFNACSYDKSEDIYPPSPTKCDTGDMHYSTDIVGILSTKCYSCHSIINAPFNGAPPLETHKQVSVYANATSKQLYNVVQHINVGASLFMPQGEPKLSDCDISKIKAWIDAGAQNN